MKRTVKDYLLYGFIAIGIAVVVLLSVNRVRQQRDVPLSRALDTVNIGTTANDGTGDPLRTAFIKVNRIIVMADSLDLDSLTNSEVQALKNMEDATAIFPTIQSAAGDTSNYAVPDKIGDIYVNISTAKVYVSVAATRGGWRILN